MAKPARVNPLAAKYRVSWPAGAPDWQLELGCWANRLNTGFTPYHHLEQAIRLMWPENMWHPWREERFEAFCDPALAHKDGRTITRNFSWMGCGAATKAQPLDATVYTPAGPKLMGEIKPGDIVCTPSGGVAEVLEVFPQGQVEIFKITLVDGSTVECCRDHLWRVSHRDPKSTKLVNTQFLIENYCRHAGGRDRREIAIPFTEEVCFDSRPVKMPPYLMGALLGNGTFGGKDGSTSLGFSSSDQETIDRVRGLIGNDYDLSYRSGCDYAIVKASHANNGQNWHIQALKEYGLWAHLSLTKFIPGDYLYNDVKIRWEILRGLMDTDGTCGKHGNPSYSTSSLQLAKDVKFLVQSLGGACRIHSKTPKFTYRGERKTGQTNYLCSIQIKDADKLFHLKRKKDRVHNITFARYGRIIQKIEFSRMAEAQCILIDNQEHLYLTDNFIPTHQPATGDLGERHRAAQSVGSFHGKGPLIGWLRCARVDAKAGVNPSAHVIVNQILKVGRSENGVGGITLPYECQAVLVIVSENVTRWRFKLRYLVSPVTRRRFH